MATDHTKTIINVGIGAAVLIVLYKVGRTFGLIQTAEERKQDEDAGKLTTGANADVNKIDLKNGSLALSPNYVFTIYKQIVADYKKQGKKAPPLSSFLSTYKYSELATSIYDSKGTFNDDEDVLFGVFRSINTQLQIAFLSNLFYKIYKRDLLGYVLSFTNNEERAQLYNIIKNKRLY